MKPTRTIQIGKDGVLYDEGDGVLTSAAPLQPRSNSKNILFDHGKEVRDLTLAKIQHSWRAIENAIDVMPANSLVYVLKEVEPLAKLASSMNPIEKSILLVAVKAELTRTVAPNWLDVVTYIITELIKNPDNSDEYVRWIINYYHSVQVRFQFGNKVERVIVIGDDSIAQE